MKRKDVEVISNANRIWARFALALYLSLPAAAWAQVSPEVLARNTTNEVLRIVRMDQEVKSGNPAKLHALVEAKILPHFDFEQMTRLAVARNWNHATPEQRQALVEQFRTLLVRTYAASISSVADYRIEFRPVRMQPGDTEVTVSTEVTRPGAPPIIIDYRMMRQGDTWKVFDVLVDNVSLVTVYRNSFNAEVRRSGIDGLIASLARRNRQSAGAR